MSALGPPPIAPGALLCPRCGNALHEQQGWCLECGLAARTRVHPPPNWRLPIATTLVVLALLAGALTFALVALLDKPEPTPAATTVTVPATPAPTATTTTTPVVTTPAATTTVPTTTTPTVPTIATPSSTTTEPGGASAPGD